MTVHLEPTDQYAKPSTPLRGLGRVNLPNPGSRNYRLRDAIPRRGAASWKTKTWRMGRVGSREQLRFQSQGSTSTCVRYGNTHILMLEPIVRVNAFELTTELYRWAQDNDPWPGREPQYFGTSVDAGLQFLLHVAELIKSYHWAFSMDDVLTRLTLPASEGGGPMVVGTDFYEGMDTMKGGGTNGRNIWIPNGDVLGGHCYVLTGTLQPTAKRTRKITVGNSHTGNFEGEMDADAMEWLLFAQGGEAAAVTELPR